MGLLSKVFTEIISHMGWLHFAGAAADDAPLGEEELEAGAWGEAELDLGEDGADGAAEPFADGEGREEGEDGEGGWEMEVR